MEQLRSLLFKPETTHLVNLLKSTEESLLLRLPADLDLKFFCMWAQNAACSNIPVRNNSDLELLFKE